MSLWATWCNRFTPPPLGGKAVSPYPFLQKAVHMLTPAPAAGKMFTLKLTGTVIAASDNELTLAVDTVFAWPSHVRQTKMSATVTLSLVNGETFTVGQHVVAFTMPALGTRDTLTGAPDALTLDRAA